MKKELGPATVMLLVVAWAMAGIDQHNDAIAQKSATQQPTVDPDKVDNATSPGSGAERPEKPLPEPPTTTDEPAASGSGAQRGDGPTPPESALSVSEPETPRQDASGAPAAPGPGSGVESAPPAVPPEPESFVHRIQVGNSHGSAVSIGGGRYITCGHVVARGGAVSIDGRPCRASIRNTGEPRDVAVVSTNLNDPGVEFSTEWPDHLAEATVIGLPGIGTERQTSTGVVADAGVAALGLDQPEIQKGQSGGGVFVDGKLIGILRGFASGNGVPANPLAAHFTPLAQVESFVSPFRPAANAPAAPAADGKPVVYVDVPAGGWCGACNALEALDQSDLEFRMEFRPVADNRHAAFPHVHVVDRSGAERCAGAIGGLAEIEAAWRRLYR